MLSKKVKRRIAKVVCESYRHRNETIPYSVSLLDERRTHWDEDGQGCKEYGFLEADDATDEEIHCWLHDNLARRVNWPAQWDCSGQLFTISIDWHRNPCGYISFVHTMGVDV